MKEVDAPALGEWTREQLETERHRLRAVLAQTQRDLETVERELRTRLEFAGAVPVATFSATAVRLIEGFEADPRPLAIYVSGTDRTCILKPADPNDLPAEVVPISKLGQYGSRLVQQVFENRARGGARIGIRRGGSRTGEVVAELCPPNQRSLAYIAVLQEMGELGENEHS